MSITILFVSYTWISYCYITLCIFFFMGTILHSFSLFLFLFTNLSQIIEKNCKIALSSLIYQISISPIYCLLMPFLPQTFVFLFWSGLPVLFVLISKCFPRIVIHHHPVDSVYLLLSLDPRFSNFSLKHTVVFRRVYPVASSSRGTLVKTCKYETIICFPYTVLLWLIS